MKPNLVNDIGLPVVIGGADIALDWWDGKRVTTDPTATRYEPFLGVAGAVAGLGLMMGNMWADKAQIILHATLPMATKAIYNWIKTATAPAVAYGPARAARPVMAGPVFSRSVGYPAPSEKPEFQVAPGY